MATTIDSLADSLEVFSNLCSDDQDYGNTEKLAPVLSSILDSLITVADDSIDDFAKEHVIIPAISTLGMIVEAGQNQEHDMNELTSIIWKSYSKLVKKYAAMFEEGTSLAFIEAISSHTMDGIVHISSILREGQRDQFDNFHKVLWFFAQRLALSMQHLNIDPVHPKRLHGFNVLMSFCGLNQLLCGLWASGSAQCAKVNDLLCKILFETIIGTNESISPQHSIQWVWKLDDAALALAQADQTVELHLGYRNLFLLLLQRHNAHPTPLLNNSDLLACIRRLLLHNSALFALKIPERRLLHHVSLIEHLDVCCVVLARTLLLHPRHGRYMLDFVVASCCTDSGSQHGHNWSLACQSRFLLLGTFTALQATQPVGEEEVLVALADSILDRLIDMYHDPVGIVHDRDSIHSLLPYILGTPVAGLCFATLRRVVESFVYHIQQHTSASSTTSSANRRLLPYALLEHILTHLPIHALSQPKPSLSSSQSPSMMTLSNMTRALLTLAVKTLGLHPNSQTSQTQTQTQTVSDHLSGSPSEALPIALISAFASYTYAHSNNPDSPNSPASYPELWALLTQTGPQQKRLNTQILQVLRTLTAQLELYGKQLLACCSKYNNSNNNSNNSNNSNNTGVYMYKICGWARHVRLLAAYFLVPAVLPQGVQTLLAECLSRLCICIHAIYTYTYAYAQSSSSASSYEKAVSALLQAALQFLHTLLAPRRSTSSTTTSNTTAVRTQKEIAYALQQLSDVITVQQQHIHHLRRPLMIFARDLTQLLQTYTQSQSQQQQWALDMLDQPQCIALRALCEHNVQQLAALSHSSDDVIDDVVLDTQSLGSQLPVSSLLQSQLLLGFAQQQVDDMNMHSVSVKRRRVDVHVDAAPSSACTTSSTGDHACTRMQVDSGISSQNHSTTPSSRHDDDNASNDSNKSDRSGHHASAVADNSTVEMELQHDHNDDIPDDALNSRMPIAEPAYDAEDMNMNTCLSDHGHDIVESAAGSESQTTGKQDSD